MNEESGIKSYGFHVFVGREITDNGNEYFVSLDLIGGGSGSHMPSMEFALDQLCHYVKLGHSVLLYHSPGRVEPRVRKNIFSEILRPAFDNIGAETCDDPDTEYDCTYILAGRDYQPFEEAQMKELRERYAAREDMKKYPSPFDDQVLIL